MFRVNSTLNRQKELLLLGLFLKKFQRNQLIEVCPVSTVVSPSQEEAKSKILPSLPVQPLENVLEKYIKSVKPFLDSSEFEKTQNLVKKFCENDNLGQKLQKLLEERGKSMDNWLADWWLQTAYLEYRDPVPVYSSPALVWPERKFETQTDQLIYAAQIIVAALNFNKNVERKKIPQDKLGNDLLCMNQYDKIFGTCRIPKIPKDELLFQNPANPSNNIIIMYNNHPFVLLAYFHLYITFPADFPFLNLGELIRSVGAAIFAYKLFSVPVFQNDEREPFSAAHFFSALTDIVQEGEKAGEPLGVLTTEHRDNWAKSYEELKKDFTNKHLLEEYVEKALFVVCIDRPIKIERDRLKYDTRCGKLLLHGFGLRGNVGNRWYDKTVQFIVGAEEDGVGIVYEHSPAEGGPIAVLTDFIHSAVDTDEKLNILPDYPKPKKLEFAISAKIKENITSAGVAINRLSDDLDVYNWSFKDFGKDELKLLKVSPDSFIQIAIQLAFYKVHGHSAAQYESGSLRKFIYGRTDTIRSCSEEVVNFCKTIANPSSTSVEISKALRFAIDSHKNYALEVLEGRGVDRHLLAFKILAKQNNIEKPEIFSDAGFERSTYFQLSTSNVPTKCDAFMVYGPLVHDGYACCYNPRDKSINFGMSAWSSCETTRLETFKQSLEDALNYMRQYLLISLKTSKL